MGNSHWATAADATALCRELNVGLILAGNTFTQQGEVRGLAAQNGRKLGCIDMLGVADCLLLTFVQVQSR